MPDVEATILSANSSSVTRLASFLSILQKFRRWRASSISLLALTGPASLQSRNSWIRKDRETAWEFLERLLQSVPYRIHTILTDNDIQFAEQPRNRNTAYSRQMRFDMICEANGIEQQLTKPNHPWTNGQVERMNRTIKEATVKRYHYDSHDQLLTHLADFMAAFNFARRLKTLNGLTPYQYICKIWTSEPDRFIINPIHQMPGLNT